MQELQTHALSSNVIVLFVAGTNKKRKVAFASKSGKGKN